MPKSRKGLIESVHQRTQRKLMEARIRSAALPKPDNGHVEVKQEQRKPIEFTFNWKDESSSPLVPNLIEEGKIESLRREFINSVAKGESSASLDKRALMNPQQFFEDTIEGIHRWHTYGKEK